MKANPKASPRINLKRILAAALFALLLAALGLVYVRFSEKPVSGSKAVTIEVISSAEKKTVYALRTDAQYLRQAMDECEGLTYSGTEGPYGIMLDTVNGERAVYSENGAYWSVTVTGQYGNYGIDEQPVEDGDAFVIACTK